MFYNSRFFPLLVLFIIFVWTTFSSIFIFKTGTFQNPFFRKVIYEGWKAKVAGFVSLSIGLSILVLAYLFYFNQSNNNTLLICESDFKVGPLKYDTPLDSVILFFGQPKDSVDFQIGSFKNPFLDDTSKYYFHPNNLKLYYFDSLAVLAINNRVLNCEYTFKRYPTFRNAFIGDERFVIDLKYGYFQTKHIYTPSSPIRVEYLNDPIDDNIKIIFYISDSKIIKIALGRF